MAKGHSLKIRVLNKHSIMINGEIKKLREIGGIRPKCFYDNYVIKFDDIDDFQQSTREIETWKNIAKEHRKYFAKLVGWNSEKGYIIQEKIEFRRGRRSNAAKKIVEEMRKIYQLGDISFCGDNDNWAVRKDGTPVIFDWGVDGVWI